MAVRIIKNGIDPINKVHEGTCRKCGCVFEFATSDAKYIQDLRDGDFLTISCPHCSWQFTKDARQC